MSPIKTQEHTPHTVCTPTTTNHDPVAYDDPCPGTAPPPDAPPPPPPPPIAADRRRADDRTSAIAIHHPFARGDRPGERTRGKRARIINR